MLSLHELLNPAPPIPHSQPPQVHRFSTPSLPESPSRTNREPYPRAQSSPPSLQREQLSDPRRRHPINLTTPTLSPHGVLSFPQSDNALLSTRHNVRLNNKTMLSALYHYKADTVLEYPCTSDTPKTSVGHLFELSPSKWSHPRLNFAYSQGQPSGQTNLQDGGHIYCSLLTDDENGEEVPCLVSHYTCQGCKICPFADLEAAKIPYAHVTQEALKLRIQQSQHLQNASSTRQALFEKTLSLYRAYQVHGCLGPPFPSPDPSDTSSQTEWETQLERFQRGAERKLTCNGKLVFGHDYEGRAFIRCQHFSTRPGGFRDHLCSFEVSNGLYDSDYLEALFEGDAEAISDYEYAAMDDGYGPLASCNNVANFSTQKLNCREWFTYASLLALRITYGHIKACEHRSEDGALLLANMLHLPCGSTIRSYEPLEDYRGACPRVLVVCRGTHGHPIPLPTKTPPLVRTEIFDLLQSIDEDLPDLTPRRFLRHSVTLAYLQQRFPLIVNPTVSHLHISLVNREHIKAFILQAQRVSFPDGTGWQGLRNLKDVQDNSLPPEQRYIRTIEEIPLDHIPVHDEDDLDQQEPAEPTRTLRIIICMTPTQSQRLSCAQYLQSDIAFKRVVGFLEFEIGGLDKRSQTAIVYCRVYLNRQTAAAHQIVLERINSLVESDTGTPLKWRHLHANSPTDLTGVLHWVGDQHGGQAKGIGLYLRALASNLPGRRDLHETHRLLSELDEYDHLRQIFRLCTTHVHRHVHEISAPDEIKNKMRSLMCVEHPDFDGCLSTIAREGGKQAADWVQNKVNSKFALPAICWQRSFIPKVVWQVGDATSNIIESLHADANSEGKFCSLVGGVKKGLRFDTMKLQSLEAFEEYGIRPSYKTGHKSESIARALKRTVGRKLKGLYGEDAEIEKANKRLRTSLHKASNANQRLQNAMARRPENGVQTSSEAMLIRRGEAADEAYDMALSRSVSLLRKGSGRQGVALPQHIADNMGLTAGQPY